MLVIGLNTAFAALDAALVRDGEIIADAREVMARGQERALPGFVDTLLREAGVALGEIDRLAVVCGPGSFTGIRIGVAYARGLALVTGASCIGVTSLEAAVPAGMAGPSVGCLMAQARAPDQTWWVQGLDHDEGIAAPVEIGLADLSAMLEGFHAPVFMDGSDALGPQAQRLDLRPMRPSAITAALKGASFDPARHLPAPVYARAPDAALPRPKE